jgi:lantibiotic modifying enzyme
LSWRTPDDERAPAPYDLHDGAIGTALFFAALGVVTDESHWLDAARATAQPVEELLARSDMAAILESHTIGVDGVSSLVYGGCWLDHLLDDGGWTGATERAVALLTPERIGRDDALDVMSGAAGALLALLAMHRRTGAKNALSAAVACGEHLLARRVVTRHRGVAWPARDRRLLAGFGHGAAGIAFALGRLFVVTEERKYREAAAGAYRYERTLYDPKRRNWPMLETEHGSGEQMLYAWCHGAPGVGLARALGLDILDDQDARGEVGDAVLATASGRIGRSDHLCCGNMGRAAVLLTIGRRVRNDDVVNAAEEIASAVLRRARERGHFGLPGSAYSYRVFSPGFFRGLAGIGFQLLQMAEPERLPSVLALEAE